MFGVSKTFTTTETLTNLDAAVEWLREAGVADPYGQLIAVTAAPDKAVEYGIDETRVLPFGEALAVDIRSGRRSAYRSRWRWAGARSKNYSKVRQRWTGMSS